MREHRTHTDDVKLLTLLRKGELYAFEKLFNKYYPLLHAYAKQYVDEESAKNIVQDVMLWLWENRENLTDEMDLSRYLYKATKNKCLNYLNHLSIRVRVHQTIERRMSNSLETEDLNNIGELEANIENALRQIPPSYREAFVMNRIQGKTYSEIAAELDVSLKTVEYRMKNCIRRLRVLLKDFL